MLTITPAQPADIPVVAALLVEVDKFYGDPDPEPADDRVTQVERVLFGTPPLAYALLARQDGEPVGMASYSYLWPASGTTTSLFLKELYVTREGQRQGVGRALMIKLCDLAEERECSRVEWTTDPDNEGAQRFYKALGFTENGKVFYRVVLGQEG